MKPSRNVLIISLTSVIPTFFSASLIGLIYGITSLLPSLLSYPLAYVVKSLGAKKGIIIGGIIRSSSIFLIYTFSPPLVITGFLMDMGIGYPLSNISRQSLIMREKMRGTNLGWFMTIAGTSAFLAPVLGAESDISRFLILLTGVSTLLASVVRALLLKEAEVKEKVIKIDTNSLITSLIFASFSLFITTDSYIIPLFSSRYLTLDELGVMFSLRILGENSLAFLFGHIIDKIGNLKAFILSVIGSVTFMLLFSLSSSPFSLIYFTIWVLFSSMGGIASQTLFYDLNKGRFEIAYGLLLLVSGVLSLPSSYLDALMLSFYPVLPFIIQAVASIIGLVILLMKPK